MYNISLLWIILQVFEKEHGSIHKLLSDSNNSQNLMEFECELITNGIVLDDPDSYESPKILALKENIGDWRLLLQVDS